MCGCMGSCSACRPRRCSNEFADVRTPVLVREYAALKVWFATNEVTRPTREGDSKHRRMGVVVDELRARGVLD